MKFFFIHVSVLCFLVFSCSEVEEVAQTDGSDSTIVIIDSVLLDDPDSIKMDDKSIENDLLGAWMEFDNCHSCIILSFQKDSLIRQLQISSKEERTYEYQIVHPDSILVNRLWDVGEDLKSTKHLFTMNGQKDTLKLFHFIPKEYGSNNFVNIDMVKIKNLIFDTWQLSFIETSKEGRIEDPNDGNPVYWKFHTDSIVSGRAGNNIIGGEFMMDDEYLTLRNFGGTEVIDTQWESDFHEALRQSYSTTCICYKLSYDLIDDELKLSVNDTDFMLFTRQN